MADMTIITYIDLISTSRVIKFSVSPELNQKKKKLH